MRAAPNEAVVGSPLHQSHAWGPLARVLLVTLLFLLLLLSLPCPLFLLLFVVVGCLAAVAWLTGAELLRLHMPHQTGHAGL